MAFITPAREWPGLIQAMTSRGWVEYMKKIILSVAITLGVSSLAMAEAEPSAERIKQLTGTCSACHGATGQSVVPNYPNLAGQGARYLATQISDIRDGNRSVPEMTAFVSNLTDAEIKGIAAYYAKQTPKTSATDPKFVALGEKLYRGGDLERGIAACSACHSFSGKGNAPAGFPTLSGQHPQYIIKQLTDYREGDRTNGGEAQIMQTIAAKLSTKEIEALGHYVSGLN